MIPRLPLAAICAVLVASSAEGQRWRTLQTSRQLAEGDTSALSVRVVYGGGKLDVRPATGASLYAMNLRYDADRMEPLARFDGGTRALSLGIRARHVRWTHAAQAEGALLAELSPRVPIDLVLELGAVDGDVDLGGLRLHDLSLKAGASDLTVRFDQPNPERLGLIALEVGAAKLRLVRAGNAGADRIRANVGLGGLDLDMGGEWTRHVAIDANVAAGHFTLRVPPDVGVYIDATTFLESVDHHGLEKRSDGMYTPGFEAAPRQLRVRLKASLGAFTLRRDAR